MLRIATFIMIGLAAAAWLWFTAVVIFVGQPGTGIGFAVIGVTDTTFLASALPALILAWKGKLLRLALALALFSLIATALFA